MQAGALARLTQSCLRHKWVVASVWIAVVVLGGVGALRLGPLLQSGFSLPGTDSNRVDEILARDFARASSAPFVLIAEGTGARARVTLAAARAVALLPAGRLDRTQPLPSGGAVVFVQSSLAAGAASAEIGPLRRALGSGILVTGDAAVQHDLAPVLARDLRVGELYLAVPAALVILLLVFGTGSALLPFVFAAATIVPSLGIAWGIAHFLALSDYLRNMVAMIGLGIAIDYSLLIVNRYRDERRHGRTHADAIVETMLRAGRTIVFSGLAVAAGLALMLVLPVPFLRGFGVGGLLVPLVSIVCALTLLPVLLLAFGERLERVRLLPDALAERRHAAELRLWASLAGWAMRRAKLLAPLVGAILVLAAMPLIGVQLGPASHSSLPPGMQAAKGLTILARSHADALDPTTIVVSQQQAGGIAGSTRAVHRLIRLLRADPQVEGVSAAARDASGRQLAIEVALRSDPASAHAQSFAARLRAKLIPEAGFPPSVQVLAGGGAAYAADFISRTLGSFPWLVLALLGLTYLLLVRAFRSLLLPLKAIVLNLLTVAAASGLMIAVFQWGWGSRVGLVHVSEIEGWIPVFMFTLLFGLSMDYEVFLVTRMREAWERTRSNTAAVVHGFSHTGRIVTAAGLLMTVTFSGLMLGSIPPMQQLGFGLAAAILIDITLVRGLLLPAAMALAGRWNWYLPVWAARAVRLKTTP